MALNNILILDDSKRDLTNIKHLVNKFFASRNLATPKITEQTTLDFLKAKKADYTQFQLLISDIVFDNDNKKENALDYLIELSHKHPMIKVILITGFVDLFPQTYLANPVYAVYKPEMEISLPKALDKAIHMLDQSVRYIPLISESKHIKVYLNNISFIEKQLRLAMFHLIKPIGDHSTISSYITFEKLYPYLSDRFIQVSHSFIVNSDYITSFSKSEVIVNQEHKISITRAYRNEVFLKLHNLFYSMKL